MGKTRKNTQKSAYHTREDDIAKRFDLNDRQARFVELYCIDFNGPSAAKGAGYKNKTMQAAANQALRTKRIQAAVDYVLKKKAKKAQIDAAKLLSEMINLGFSDLGDFVSWDESGDLKFKPSNEIPADKRRAIQEITQTTLPSGAVKLTIKLHPKSSYIKLIAQHLGMLPSKVLPPSGEDAAESWADFLLNLRQKLNTKALN